MKNDLIERYIYAVTRYLPLREREEVAKELDSLIADMLEARCGAVTVAEKDIRVVLTELGTPQEIAMKYSGDEDQSLISGVYFLIYKRILAIVLPIAAIVLACASAVAIVAQWNAADNPYHLLGQVIGQTLGGALTGVVQAFAIITLVFAILQRRNVVFHEGDVLANLPAVPSRKARIRPWEPVFAILWSVVFVTLFLGVPQAMGVWFHEIDRWVPLFSTSVIRSMWLPIVVWAVLGIAKEAVKLIEGRYTFLVALTTVISNILILLCAGIIFIGSPIINPQFVSRFPEMVSLVFKGRVVVYGAGSLNLICIGVVAFALLIDSITVVAKAWRYTKDEAF